MAGLYTHVPLRKLVGSRSGLAPRAKCALPLRFFGKLLRSLQEKTHQWWYFLAHPEIPPDNNLAERTLRLAVTKRKVSGGSRSMERLEHTANLLTVIQTCRRQGRSVIQFFEQAIKAIVNPTLPPPSLIPQFST